MIIKFTIFNLSWFLLFLVSFEYTYHSELSGPGFKPMRSVLQRPLCKWHIQQATQEQKEKRQPYQRCLLEAVTQIWVGGVDR